MRLYCNKVGKRMISCVSNKFLYVRVYIYISRTDTLYTHIYDVLQFSSRIIDAFGWEKKEISSFDVCLYVVVLVN